MIDSRLKDLRGPGRRQFLRWSATVAASLGVERSRFLNVIGETGGVALADTAACASTNRLISIVAGEGGLANFTQVFPFTKVIGSVDGQATHYAMGQGIPSIGFDKLWVHAPHSPFQQPACKWKMSAFLSGTNEAHTKMPVSAIRLGGNNGMLASAAAIQQANPTLLPVLTVGGLTIGTAPGMPDTASVGSASEIVELFNSEASRALLGQPDNASLADAYYKAFIGLNASAGRTTNTKQLGIGKVSMGLLARNLAARLTPTASDQLLFGLTASTSNPIREMSIALISSIKAFSLGLTSMLVMPGFNNDPHNLFAKGNADAAAMAEATGKMFNGIHNLAQSLPDPSCSAKTLAETIVLSCSGDTFKSPFSRVNGKGESDWGDGTPSNSNVLYVMGAGYTRTGWFGDMDRTAGAVGWDPATGNTGGAYMGGPLGSAAAAAVLFAVAKGDLTRVQQFYPGGSLLGITVPNNTG